MMNTRSLGHSTTVTECGLGCWQLGGGWGGEWDDGAAQEILRTAYDSGIRFFDTADVYGGGASEKAVGAFQQEKPDVFVATKLGRAGMYPDGYSKSALRDATLASRDRLGMTRLDLTQLHCVPTEVLREGEVFDWLRDQREEGLIQRFGASVESVEEGLICLEQEGLTSLQIIFNIFRQKPAQELLPRARDKCVGIIVRLPLASGLLTGKLSRTSTFEDNDHRSFNRDGESFNVGETFAGLPFETGVELAEDVKRLLPADQTMAASSLRWILDHEAVSVVIPGASRPEQAQSNAAVSGLPSLPSEVHQALKDLYRERVQDHIRGPY